MDEATYFAARTNLAQDLATLTQLETHYMQQLVGAVQQVARDMAHAMQIASLLKPFWKNYPPLQRGRSPSGTSIPWQEVGETVMSAYVVRAFANRNPGVIHVGLPSGSDLRFMTGQALIHLDIKLTGPNDRADEIVASPNQLSGDGSRWKNDGVINSPVTVTGQRARMTFQPELSPLYILNGDIYPCLTYFLKGVYSVTAIGEQPLMYLELVCAPNGLMAFAGPNYNQAIEGLFIPGKDEKKHPKKRVRLRMEPLASVDAWRRHTIWRREET